MADGEQDGFTRQNATFLMAFCATNGLATAVAEKTFVAWLTNGWE
jgi:hypothetical protein